MQDNPRTLLQQLYLPQHAQRGLEAVGSLPALLGAASSLDAPLIWLLEALEERHQQQKCFGCLLKIFEQQGVQTDCSSLRYLKCQG